MRRAGLWILLVVAAAGVAPRAAAAQAADDAYSDDAYLDDAARVLHAQARAWFRSGDSSLVRYQARVSQRMAASLRMPLRDRTFYRYEAAARLLWQRDAGVAVQLLASREEFPGGVNHAGRPPGVFQQGYDPRRDPLILGLEYTDNPEVRVVHPLGDDAERHYRFRTGDTLTVSLPDGHSVRAVELELLPRTDDPHLLSGALWIEPETGALVRAVYRPARDADLVADTHVDLSDPAIKRIPGMFRPFTVSVTMVTVDYTLWDLRVWMPRSVHAEGTLHAGVLALPMTMDLSYDVESVVTRDQQATPLGLDGAVAQLTQLGNAAGETTWRADVRGRRRQGLTSWYVTPTDRTWLETSPYLPAPAWDADSGPLGAQELADLRAVLDALPPPPKVAPSATFAWGLKRPDLIRYNRVEGLSVGAREAVRFGWSGVPLDAALTARLGAADRVPRATLSITRASPTRTLTLSGYRELEPADPATRALGIGNSLSAALFGRDDGDYDQATGASLLLGAPSAARGAARLRVYAERQEPVARATDASLFEWLGWSDGFRPSLPAARADQVGVDASLAPTWGQDPARPRAGLELQLRAERGTFDFERASLGAHATLPLLAGARFAVEAAGGSTWGDAPPQRLWRLGGPASLRAFAPGVAVGRSFVRGRAELARPLADAVGVGAVALAAFTDAGWAGEPRDLAWTRALASSGVGLSILDGMLRVDWAWGWHGASGRRLDVYLDGIL